MRRSASPPPRRSARAGCATSKATCARRAPSRVIRRKRCAMRRRRSVSWRRGLRSRKASSSPSKRSTRNCRATATNGSWPRSSRCSPSPRSSCNWRATSAPRFSRCSSPKRASRAPTGRRARAGGRQSAPIRGARARDIERLKALPAVDIAGMSMRIGSVVAAVDSLPLAFDERGERAPASKSDAANPERGFWSRLGSDIWGELRQLVVVRQMNAPEPPLLPPTQAYFLRENLRLRLLNARLSLLTRDEGGYREDLRAAQAWLARYFDTRSKQTAEALAQLKQLSSASLSFEMPTISESLEAVRGFKSRRERAPG